MSATTTVPGSIPGLLRDGAAMFDARDEMHGTALPSQIGGFLVYSPTEGDGDLHAMGPEWEIDLTEPAGWDAAVAWLARRWDLRPHERAVFVYANGMWSLARLQLPDTILFTWSGSGMPGKDQPYEALRAVVLHEAGLS